MVNQEIVGEEYKFWVGGLGIECGLRMGERFWWQLKTFLNSE